ncbi:MAG: NAD(P)H-hydrate dehydratase, partial [Betaproteobacteria bacterium]|nr:NAD(P)H-hydrate dehydratase [Betaproteobacteria bacterium]
DPQAPAVDPLYPELMLRPADTLLAGWSAAGAPDGSPDPDRLPLTALVAGPGMGASPQAARLLAQAMAAPVPLLLDADALNLLARRADLVDRLLGRTTGRTWADAARAPNVILTPHPAEAARLLHQSFEEVQADRPAAARALAGRYRCVAVLKGAGTLVAWPVAVGDAASGAAAAGAVHLARNPTGNNRLATAGTGDVLAGLIGALLARGLDAPGAARLGVWVHGRAGELLPDERPTASGLLLALAGLLAEAVAGSTAG